VKIILQFLVSYYFQLSFSPFPSQQKQDTQNIFSTLKKQSDDSNYKNSLAEEIVKGRFSESIVVSRFETVITVILWKRGERNEKGLAQEGELQLTGDPGRSFFQVPLCR
jgi:hypothetical protein